MKHILLTVFAFFIWSCNQKNINNIEKNITSKDSVLLANMISIREKAMIEKDIKTAMSQFSDDVTWINSQGYYFEGKNEVSKFHNMLSNNDSLDYYYEAGLPKIRLIDNNNGVAYYSWKMFWYKKNNPNDTINKEIGLMTLHAKKNENSWKWIAITNQHTPWFYESIEPGFID